MKDLIDDTFSFVKAVFVEIWTWILLMIIWQQIQVRIQGGAPGPRAPPLTLGFEAPKLSIFGPYLIFP